jgi:hypothetical protein
MHTWPHVHMGITPRAHGHVYQASCVPRHSQLRVTSHTHGPPSHTHGPPSHTHGPPSLSPPSLTPARLHVPTRHPTCTRRSRDASRAHAAGRRGLPAQPPLSESTAAAAAAAAEAARARTRPAPAAGKARTPPPPPRQRRRHANASRRRRRPSPRPFHGLIGAMPWPVLDGADANGAGGPSTPGYGRSGAA